MSLTTILLSFFPIYLFIAHTWWLSVVNVLKNYSWQSQGTWDCSTRQHPNCCAIAWPKIAIISNNNIKYVFIMLFLGLILSLAFNYFNHILFSWNDIEESITGRLLNLLNFRLLKSKGKTKTKTKWGKWPI